MILISNWRDLALAESNYQNVDLNIVLATVEAETGGANIIGDNGNAMGYGQVWWQWHTANFEYAARRLNITLPTTIDGIRNLTLNNDRFSMIVAVRTIGIFWYNAGKNWRNFTLSYVGANIPLADYQRRERIWNKYRDGSDIAGMQRPEDVTQPKYGKYYEVEPSNLQVLPESLQIGNKLYGRRYRILVVGKNGTALDVSDLRCTFQTVKLMMAQPNTSEITIYNLNASTENTLIEEGSRIVIEAGYEGNQYGVIFDGDVLQPIREKEDGTTYKLTITALDGDRFFNSGVINFSYIKGQTARDVISQIASKATVPTELGDISSSLRNDKLTRGKTVFGLGRDYLKQISEGQNATFYLDNGKVNIIKLSDLPEDEIINLSPESGLLSSPQQTDFGIRFKCLLNPRIQLNTFIKIDNRLVRESKFEPVISTDGKVPSSAQVIRQLDKDGIYRIIKITHTGDTRGNDWHTECETVAQAGTLPALLQNPEYYGW